MDLKNHAALVTGGASGLGLATVARLVSAGARVVVADLSAGRRTVTESGFGNNVVFAEADVTDNESLSAAVDLARELGPLRLAVSCAGIVISRRVLGRDGVHPADEFDRTLRVNVLGTFNLVRLSAAVMSGNEDVDGERGVIVATASIAAFDGQIGQAAYSASKAAVAGMTLPLARDLASHHIRVVTIAPGMFATPMVAGLPPDAQASLAAQVPHPSRFGRPEEYASLVLHIVENPMLNGETIRLDGAIRMGAR